MTGVPMRQMQVGLALALTLALPVGAQPRDYTQEPAAAKDARMQWWRDARFGIFIHWGVYAVAGGEWKAERTDLLLEILRVCLAGDEGAGHAPHPCPVRQERLQGDGRGSGLHQPSALYPR